MLVLKVNVSFWFFMWNLKWNIEIREYDTANKFN